MAMRHLYDSLRRYAKKEVKAEFCKMETFALRVFALRVIGHYTENALREFKYDHNFRNPEVERQSEEFIEGCGNRTRPQLLKEGA